MGTAKNKLACGRPAETSGPAAAPGSWRKKLDSHLLAKTLKRSSSRDKIIEVAFGQAGHFTVQELIGRVRGKHPTVGAATVYRNIPVLVEAGLLKETLTDDQGQSYYEVSTGDHHDHIICMDCSRIFEFHDEHIEMAQDKVSAGLRFAPVKHRHVIYARCEYRLKR